MEWLFYLKTTGAVTDEEYRVLKRDLLRSIPKSRDVRMALDELKADRHDLWIAFQTLYRLTAEE